ncbi:MAG: MFS transporter [Lachnospiraceae bacterium]|nr:MFS transporter [Lachnospiraceae bacterium]
MVQITENKTKDKLTARLRRNIALDYIITFITNLNMQSSIWVLYLAYCGLNLAQIGLVEGIYHATSIVFEIPSGAVADLLGRKKSMILSKLCIAVSCIIMLFARSFWFFALSFVIQALGNNLNSGSEEALVYDSMKYAGREEQYLRVCGRLNMIMEVSQGIATVVGGILAEFSYFWCYSACVVIAVLALVPVVLMTEAPYADADDGQKSVSEVVCTHFKTCFGILRSDRRILHVIVYYSVVFAAQTLLFFYSQQYYYDLGYNKIQISLIMLAVGGVSCAGAAMSERIFARFGRKTGVVGALVIAAAFLGYGGRSLVVSIAALLAANFFNSVLYPVQSEQLNSLIPSGQRATLISVNSLFFSIGMIVLFPAAGILADKWGLTTVLVGIGLALLAFVCCWNIWEKRK